MVPSQFIHLNFTVHAQTSPAKKTTIKIEQHILASEGGKYDGKNIECGANKDKIPS